MLILLYAICGAVIGWSLGIIAVVMAILLNDLWDAITAWLSEVRWRIGWWRRSRRWAREGMPLEYMELASSMDKAQRVINASMPTMRDVANAIEIMNKR